MAEPQQKFITTDDGKVRLRDAEGNFYKVAPSGLGDALRRGYRPATAVEAGEYDAKRELEQRRREAGLLEGVTAFGEGIVAGAADVATAGARVAQMLGREAVATAVHPFDAEAAERASAAPDLLPTGREAISAGVEALYGSAGREAYEQEARAGMEESPIAATAGQVLGGVLATGGLAGPVGGIAARVGTEAAIGGGLAVGQAGEDAFLRDQKLTSEKTLAALGLGALLGGGVALGVSGAARAFRRTGSRGATPFDSPRAGGAYRAAQKADEFDALVERAAGTDPAPGAGAKLRDAVEGLQSAATGAERETLGTYGALRWDSTARTGRQLWRNRDEILEGATRDLTGNLDDLARNSRDVFDEVVDARLKRDHVRAKLTGDGATMLDAARAETARLRSELQAVALDAGRFGNKALVRNTRKLVAELAGDVRATDDVAEAFIALDRAKRALQRERVALGRSAARQPDAFRRNQALALGQKFDELQEGTRTLLMDEGVWGAAAADQRAINAAWEGWFESKRLFDQHFLVKTGETFDGRPIMAADPNKVSGYVRKLGRQEAALVDEHFRHHVMATQRLSDAIDSAFDLGAKQAQVRTVREAAETISRTLTKADETVKVANQIDAVISAEGSSGLPSTLLGGAIGGPVGAALGAAFGVATKPGSLIKSVAAIEALAANVDSKILKSIRRVLDAPAPSFPQLPGRGTSGAGRRLPAKRAAVSATMRELTSSDDDRRETYRKRVREVVSVTTNPALATERLRGATAAVAGDMPKLAGLIGFGALQGAQFLASKIPAGAMTVGPYGSEDDTEASDEEITRFNLYWHTVNNPLSVLEDLENGMLMEEQVEALAAVYPDMLQDLRMKVQVELAGRKRPPPFDVRGQLELLLDLGGIGEPSLAPDFQARWQSLAEAQAEQEQAQPRPSRGGKSVLSDMYQTKSASMEEM